MDKGISSIIKDLDPDDDEQLASLVKIIREKSLKEPRELVQILHSKDEEAAEKAAAVLLEIQDLALISLLAEPNPDEIEDFIWDVQAILAAHLYNRSRIVKILEALLLDKTPLELPVFPMDVEETPVQRRACDEAYLMMRRLFALEDEETELINTELYLDMTDEERDAEINKVKKTKKWLSLLDRMDEEDEF